MKKFLVCITIFACLLFCSCSRNEFQEYYDLGIRYISEGEYEEAIIAFTSAIEIDPKSAPAYEGRGDAYAALGEWGSAVENYSTAIESSDAAPELIAKLDQAREMDSILPENFLFEFTELFDYAVLYTEYEMLLSTPTDIAAYDSDGVPWYYWKAMLGIGTQISSERSSSFLSSAEEQTIVAEGRHFNSAYSTDELQTAVDRLWGKNRVHVDRWTSDSKNLADGVFVTDAGYFLITNGGSDGGTFHAQYYRICDAQKSGDVYTVQLNLLCFDHYENVWDSINASVRGIVSYTVGYPSDFDQAIALSGIGEAQLSVIEYTVYDTDEGLRIWGVTNVILS